MAKKVEIVSSEMVKPSSPTPESLRIYNLSLKDQMGAHSPPYAMILFYATHSPDFATCLKESLQLVLNHDCMYPLSGRIKDMYSIECNDQGVMFIQARVNEEFSNIVKNPKHDLYLQLFAPLPTEVWANPCDREFIAVQVSEFVNGGIAISAMASHCLTDASALAFFFKTWAEIALARSKGEIHITGDGFVVDCTSIFPPLDVVYVVKDPPKGEDLFGDNTRENVFRIKASSIATIREKASSKGERKATRYEATSAFLWAAIIAARKKSGKLLRAHVNCNALNLRTRLIPPLPLHCLGNLSDVAPSYCGATEGVPELSDLVEKIRDSINKVTHEEVVKRHASEDMLNGILKQMERTVIVSAGIGLLVTSSFCRFPFYEVDFGWGKPTWVGFDRIKNNFVFFMDTVDEDGFEVWIRLPKEEMEKLEQDEDFISYVSSIQSL